MTLEEASIDGAGVVVLAVDAGLADEIGHDGEGGEPKDPGDELETEGNPFVPVFGGFERDGEGVGKDEEGPYWLDGC